jgi:hypothetical protein
LREGNWIRLNPAGPLVDRAEKTTGDFTHPANKPHANNRWVQLQEVEVPPLIKDAWYTANGATGKPDYAYVEFDKAVDIQSWFNGGKVKFESGKEVSVTSANIGGLFAAQGGRGNTLRIDLAKAYPESQKSIRTSGVMAFTLAFNPAVAWPGYAYAAQDRAAPVLAGAVILKPGYRQGAYGSERDYRVWDTLVVTYSEEPSAKTMMNSISCTTYDTGRVCDTLSTHLTIQTGNDNYTPSLKLARPVVHAGNGYCNATYIFQWTRNMDFGGASKDFVCINASAGIADMNGNVQNDTNNVRVALKHVAAVSSTGGITVGANPAVTRSGGISFLRSGAVMAERASLYIYNSTGDVIKRIAVSDNPADGRSERVVGKWDLRDFNGRTVPAGTYAVKGVITTIDGKKESVSVIVGVVK